MKIEMSAYKILKIYRATKYYIMMGNIIFCKNYPITCHTIYQKALNVLPGFALHSDSLVQLYRTCKSLAHVTCTILPGERANLSRKSLDQLYMDNMEVIHASHLYNSTWRNCKSLAQVDT